jgi:hypothetical protein
MSKLLFVVAVAGVVAVAVAVAVAGVTVAVLLRWLLLLGSIPL